MLNREQHKRIDKQIELYKELLYITFAVSEFEDCETLEDYKEAVANLQLKQDMALRRAQEFELALP